MTDRRPPAELFHADVLTLDEPDIDAMVARLAEGRRQGMFRQEAHRSIKAGRTPRPRKEPNG